MAPRTTSMWLPSSILARFYFISGQVRLRRGERFFQSLTGTVLQTREMGRNRSYLEPTAADCRMWTKSALSILLVMLRAHTMQYSCRPASSFPFLNRVLG